MRLAKEENALASLYPELVEEWDFENNDGITPDQVTKGSIRLINWVCKNCGYHWPARISDRTYHNSKCPRCAKKIVIIGENDLISTDPLIAQEWDINNNEKMLPEQFSRGSSTVVNWKCRNCGYCWPARIKDRIYKRTGCPQCSGRKTILGSNDLYSSCSDLVQEWDYENNDGKAPTQFTKGSNEIINWICHKCYYKWPASIKNRVHGSGCPCCAGRVIVVGKNDLASQRLEVAKDWDAVKNAKLPNEVFVYSHDSAYWRCHNCGWEWEAIIKNRSHGTGCPACRGYRSTSRRKVV